jgi:alpha-mannosidase
MSTILSKIQIIKKKNHSYWSERVLSQMLFLQKMLHHEKHDEYYQLLVMALDSLIESFEREGVLSDSICQKAEAILSPASKWIKKYEVICAAHAHIDMNWMWTYDETVAVTLDTFRTMLDFMDEFPEFTFSQSQASVYRIVEEYDPDLLERIRKRVQEGRWELTASSWVEADKNMPNGESLSRHILYTKGYLAQLFDIDPATLKVDFEPDTFGHSHNVPEILNKGGVEFYYHCRGDSSGILLQNWVSPSGASVLVNIEPDWYNSELNPDMVMYMPEFWDRTGAKTLLRVYGVGNHGGGPTRRDIERYIDMAQWPIFPTIKFGTIHEYFEKIKKIKDKLPVVRGEKNAIFTGCYTSQSRIKMANRVSEDRLYDGEALCAAASEFEGLFYNIQGFTSAWKKTLFNQFHDIIPGSGIIGTREYAMGEFQKVMARVNTEQSRAMRSIADKIDTRSLFPDHSNLLENSKDSRVSPSSRLAYSDKDLSEGAGVGFGLSFFESPQTERGRGINRVYHFFNTLPYEREELSEFYVWDWPGDPAELSLSDEEGNELPFQILEKKRTTFGSSTYWGHEYIHLLTPVKVPPLGYSTLKISQKEKIPLSRTLDFTERTHVSADYVLENSRLHVEFDPWDMSVISLLDKSTGEDMVSASRPSCRLLFKTEDSQKGMSSWIIGRIKEIKDMGGRVKNVVLRKGDDLLRQSLSWEFEISQSRGQVSVSLDRDGDRLDYVLDCEWLEVGSKERGIPRLDFSVPFSYACEQYSYGTPFGSINRKEDRDDRPGIGYALARKKTGSGIMVHSKTKYGYAGFDNGISLDLIRSSFDPDPHPELCHHHMELAVQVLTGEVTIPEKESLIYRHPFSFISGKIHGGTGSGNASYMELDDAFYLSALKRSEDGKGLILRFYNPCESSRTGTITFKKAVKSAQITDMNETVQKGSGKLKWDGEIMTLQIEAFAVETVKVLF